jgi:hypothetical protein
VTAYAIAFEAAGGPDQPSIIQRIVDSVLQLHRDTPLQDFVFRSQPGDPSTLKLYRWRTLDGRAWKQAIDFSTSATSPRVTFSFNDAFAVSEFVPHRALRAAVI